MTSETTRIARLMKGLRLAKRVAGRLPIGTRRRRAALAAIDETRSLYFEGSAWRRFFENLSPALIDDPARVPEDQRRALFLSMVRLVEFEPHAYCNRVCGFCPNATFDRRGVKDALPFDLYRNAIAELADIGYAGGIRFARYSEPLAFDTIVDYVREARRALPESEIDIVSNGDYLNRELLAALVEAGLSVLRISIYPKGDAWTAEAAREQLDKLAARSGLEPECTLEAADRLHWRLPHPDIEITATASDFWKVGFDRGHSVEGLVDDGFVRVSPCAMVFDHVTIDFDGTVMPCCNLRGDIEPHAPYRVGSLAEDGGILGVYFSQALAGWRRGLWSVGPKEAPCDGCKQMVLNSDLANRFAGNEVARRLSRR